MYRNSRTLAFAAIALALTVSACSKDSSRLMGPDATEKGQAELAPPPQCESAPAAPTQLFASSNEANAVSIFFIDNADNEEGFLVRVAKVDTSRTSPRVHAGSDYFIAAHDADSAGHPWVTYSIEGLESGYHYKVYVEAYNSAGTARSNVDVGWTAPAEDELERLAAPLGPDTLFVSTNSATEISVAFVDRDENEDGFWLYYAKVDIRKESPRIHPRDSVHIAAHVLKNGINVVTESITNVEAGFHYRVWVQAYNAAGASQPCLAMGSTQYQEERDDLIVTNQRESNDAA